MAQTGFTPISNYYSATATNVPTAGNLVAGELAINTADGKLFYKDSSGVVQTMASKATTAGTYSSITTSSLTIGTTQLGAGNASIMKNRIINGAMVIDQRNAGASVTPASSTYSLDRWQASMSAASKFSFQQNAGSVTPPTGFSNYLGVTSTSAYSVSSTETFLIRQPIEGFNTADLGFGTANAKTVTLSFWVQSSLTGTFGGALYNGDGTRSYPFTYTISSANTWTQISVTIAGDTSGTWVGATNGIGLYVSFSLGSGSTRSGTAGAWASAYYPSATGATSVVGTNGATFYITGVQLEVGSSATGYEYENYTSLLSKCQRYCPVVIIRDSIHYSGFCWSTSACRVTIPFQVETRVAPTGITTSATVQFLTSGLGSTGTAVFGTADVNHADIAISGGSGLTSGGSTALTTSSISKIIFTGCEL
jgi:hypothetical protein